MIKLSDLLHAIIIKLKDLSTNKLDANKLGESVTDALAQAKASGEFDGKDGKSGIDGTNGKDGKDGITPHIGENGNWFIGDTDTGMPSRGEAGPQGDKGDTGANGKDGAQGPAGKDGAQGPKGDTGEQGPQGIQGEKGDKGDKGDTGAAGIDGISVTGVEINSDGNLVISFSNGQRSELGNVIGAKGDKGDTGATGQQGDQGDKGDTGAAGKDGVSVTKTEINSKGELVITLSDNTVSNLGVVVGAKGEKGDKGDKGEQGIQGIQGIQGEKGEQGIQGLPGKDGADGEDGYTPVKGEDYFTEVDKQEIAEQAASMVEIPDFAGYVVQDTAPTDTSVLWVDTSDDSNDGFQEAVNMALAQAKASGEFDGANGKTPVKGTDYFTDTDKAEMVNAVIAALPVYAGEVV